ncbi:AAHS family 4-hydroxybenzoate transporter-like MFS transporter [Herbaspirillum sp. Sphag1AN]|uniref:MFS transporter n=1 Tax=unclassified Herbaspirillum TaxID=2624150 RepID=UPI00161FA276|nr:MULTISPECIES: MFS transporter [unclassified Herbaspirillum]MBB3213064.1 AAHS family 4-hydroxybenzoate transporter-like MFS transporter [Herbaspirillum sp. Sphag1AN]MBB3246261.1 AAHS family 4-hydroxybenzoate transporter-like MFS transporter [Herbaspirillum sp. Sphag64]
MQATSQLYLKDVIDQRPVSWLQWRAIAICILIAVLDGFDTQTIGMLAPAISKELVFHISRFGPIFSAGLVGMLIGAMVLGPLADRLGRKTMVIISTILFGALSLVTSYAGTYDQLLLCRFMTGVGLGGALPNALALASEYSPKRYARIIVTTLMCGMPLGAVLGGITTSLLLPVHGWHSVFIVGGILPLALALAAAAFMPESARFLILKGSTSRRFVKLIQRLAPDLPSQQNFEVPSSKTTGVPIRELFTGGRWRDTLLLWIPYFMNLVVLYFIVSWMPAVLFSANHPVAVGIAAVSLFSAGGVLGSVLQGWLMNYFGVRKTLIAELLIYAALAFALSAWSTSYVVVLAISTLMGIAIQGVQAGLNAMATEIYPTHMRGTGVGFAIGIGRIGSICGPLAGSLMLSLQLDVAHIFLMGIVPATLAIIAIAINRRMDGGAYEEVAP